jgi:rod shape-determining protein MreD
MRFRDHRWLLVFGCNLLLWWLTGLANHSLPMMPMPGGGVFSTHLYLGGLLVAYPALRLDARHGLIAIVLTALLCDAATPVPFGTSLALFGLVHAFLLYGRQRFPREEVVFGVVVALLSNLFIFLALSFLLVRDNPRPGEAWLRLFLDLIVSQVVLALVAPWFLALQARAFSLAHVHPETGRALAD